MMELLDFLISIILLIVALLSLACLLFLLLHPLMGIFKGGKERSKVGKAGKRLEKVESLFQSDKRDSALKELRKSFIVKTPNSLSSISPIREHNQNVLSRCLLAAEEMGTKAENIAEVEHILLERTELLSLYLKAKDSYNSLKFRRQKAGKKTPTWSKADFETRLKQISEELARNEKALDEALNKLFLSLKNTAKENIVYH